MKHCTSAVAIAAAILIDGQADTLSFDFEDPRGVSNVAFNLDAPLALESIEGTAKGFSGSVNADPTDLTTAIGKIVVATKSLAAPNPLMRMHLLSKDWLDARSDPEITSEIRKVTGVRKKGANSSEVVVSGAFSLNGITKEIILQKRTSSTCLASWPSPATASFRETFLSFGRISKSDEVILASGQGNSWTRFPMKLRFR